MCRKAVILSLAVVRHLKRNVSELCWGGGLRGYDFGRDAEYLGPFRGFIQFLHTCRDTT
jgi:hypothetical protein